MLLDNNAFEHDASVDIEDRSCYIPQLDHAAASALARLQACGYVKSPRLNWWYLTRAAARVLKYGFFVGDPHHAVQASSSVPKKGYDAV